MSRPSPSISATKCKVGEIKIGNDKNRYKVIIDKNGVKRWRKIKPFDKTKYINKAFRELQKNGIIAIPNPINNIGMRYSWLSLVRKKIYSTKEYRNILKKIGIIVNDENSFNNNKNKFSFIFQVNYPDLYPSELLFRHSIIKKDKPIVVKILKKHFGENFKWNRSNSYAITIKTGLKWRAPKLQFNEEITEKLNKWTEKYPNASFKRINGMKQPRWTSPDIEKALKRASHIEKELRKFGIKGRKQAQELKDEKFPFTPWVSPKKALEELEEQVEIYSDILKSFEMNKRKKRKNKYLIK